MPDTSRPAWGTVFSGSNTRQAAFLGARPQDQPSRACSSGNVAQTHVTQFRHAPGARGPHVKEERELLSSASAALLKL